MIHAAVKHKINISTCEDSKTSTILGNMLHLPSDMFWRIIKDSCRDGEILPHAGEISYFHFWPNYSAKNDEISNSFTVEPDVVIGFDNIDVIIEAKLRDTHGQYQDQWKNEVISFIDMFGSTKPIYLIALGGCNLNTCMEEFSYSSHDIKVVKCKWFSLLSAINSERNRLSKPQAGSQEKAYIRILDDIIAGFNFHDEFYTEWMDSISNQFLNIKNQSIAIFKNINIPKDMTGSDINQDKVSTALIDVRRAHRLIYEYQDRVNKIVQYIQHKFNMPICKGKKLFSWTLPQGDYKDGWANLTIENRWAWDLIYSYLFEFHLGFREIDGKSISISIIEVSDDGYFRANNAARTDTDTFKTVEDSSSFFLFIFEYAKDNHNLKDMYNNKDTRRNEIERIISQMCLKNNDEEIIDNEKQYLLGIKYDISLFNSVESTDNILRGFNDKIKKYTLDKIHVM